MAGRKASRRPPEETRAHIVSAAGPVFGALGFEAAGTRALAAAGGVNISTLAYHFGDKEGLYHAVLDDRYARVLAFPVPEDLPDSAEERVRALVGAVYRFARLHQDSVRILLRHVLDHGRLPEPVRARWTERSFERLVALQAALPGVPLLERRLELLSLNHLLARYAITADDGLDGFVDGDPDAMVARHLGDIAAQLLLPSAPPQC